VRGAFGLVRSFSRCCGFAHEWQVIREQAAGLGDADVSVEVPTDVPTELPASAPITRYATASDTTELRILPVLPDRSVVTRPERPAHDSAANAGRALRRVAGLGAPAAGQ